MEPYRLEELLQRADATGDLTREEVRELLELQDPEQVRALLETADRVRAREVGDEVHIRGLIEFSNHCRKNCAYCGMRRDNAKLERYRMSPEEIVDLAVQLDARGIRTAVLQSGEDAWYTGPMLAGVVRAIKSRTDMAVTLSVGERPYEDYALWRDAGADRYLLRHETVNARLFDRMETGSSLDNRLRCIRDLRELGYQVGIGFMVGLPGQTTGDLADDLMFAREFQPDMLGIGPFIPHPDTPLGDQPGGTLEMSLKCVALGRILTRNALMPATTAIGSIDEFGREKALQAGANVVMPNYTPPGRREKYEIYPNKRCVGEDPALCHGCLQARILAIGRTVATGRGDSPKKRAPTGVGS
jgi:biotin synthase